jgi:DNA invertase Pin-like site-specific DNA recombinase
VDHGVSGVKERRPGLDALVQVARRRQIDVIVCTKLDRLARSLAHLVALGGEFKALGIDLVILDQAIDTTTAAGRAMFGMLAVFAEFERDLIRERVVAGLQRAKALGKRLGRPPSAVSRGQVVALREAGFSYRRKGSVPQRDSCGSGPRSHLRDSRCGLPTLANIAPTGDPRLGDLLMERRDGGGRRPWSSCRRG